jgi:hypothetical protein
MRTNPESSIIKIGTVNFSAEVNVYGYLCVKRNGVVTLTVELDGNTFPIRTATTIGTIEDGFRPYERRLLITGYVDNRTLGYDDSAVVQLGVDGTIVLSTNKNGFIVFSVSYVTDK